MIAIIVSKSVWGCVRGVEGRGMVGLAGRLEEWDAVGCVVVRWEGVALFGSRAGVIIYRFRGPPLSFGKLVVVLLAFRLRERQEPTWGARCQPSRFLQVFRIFRRMFWLLTQALCQVFRNNLGIFCVYHCHLRSGHERICGVTMNALHSD